MGKNLQTGIFILTSNHYQAQSKKIYNISIRTVRFFCGKKNVKKERKISDRRGCFKRDCERGTL